ncbi:hypothetical protein GCM10018793_43390 [Streptomyces sulfonofaciens]|uniref:Uncharacterized protein n=1 Tax=Streptomyces sulfonofaciens TaxID=68272 RepID=A0A919L4X8_9ACTN|nr:hypothetical protein [Streptomyces sulfonofaciens]GHH82826.1 hypothetical protein GCM10018793_43390 [Streptomyces sulfonofaciens]
MDVATIDLGDVRVEVEKRSAAAAARRDETAIPIAQMPDPAGVRPGVWAAWP